jgi:hypothetical protein
MRRCPISNQTARMVDSNRCQALSGGTHPNIRLVVVLETRYAQLFASAMRAAGYPLQAKSGEDQEDRISSRHEYFRVYRLEH